MDQPPPLAGCSPLVTPEIERVVMRALEKDPSKRPDTVADFVEEFRYVVTPVARNDAGSPDLLAETINLDAVSMFEEDREQFAGELTLVGYDPEPEEPEVDLNQTILLAKPGNGWNRTATHKVETKVDSFSEQSSQADFDMTLVPGSLKHDVTDRDPVQPAADVQPAMMSEPEVIGEEYADDFIFDSVNDDASVPRSIPPIILAVGVVVFIALIAIGIYYSRTAQ